MELVSYLVSELVNVNHTYLWGRSQIFSPRHNTRSAEYCMCLHLYLQLLFRDGSTRDIESSLEN
jgi:hypothetical protein